MFVDLGACRWLGPQGSMYRGQPGCVRVTDVQLEKLWGCGCVSAGCCVLGLGTQALNCVLCVVEPRCGEMIISRFPLLLCVPAHTQTRCASVLLPTCIRSIDLCA